MKSRIHCSIMTAAMLLAVGSALAQQPYAVVDHWKLGGIGGWDYLLADPGAHMLYLTHGTRVEVVDTQTGKAAGAITGLKGTHGIALDPDGKVGYISDGGANAVVIFDRETFATLGTVATGTNPDGLTYEPKTKTVWAFNGRSNNATVIDTERRVAIATMALPGKPEFPQVDGKGNVYVNIEDKNSIVKLDAATHTITATWPMAGCESPSGLAIDTGSSRLFAVCDGDKMGVVDTKTGKVLKLAPIGGGPDAAGYNAKADVAFSSNGEDGTVSVIDGKTYKPLQTIKTATGGRTMAYDSGTDRVYVVTAEYGPRPAATAAAPRPRAPVLPDSFGVVVIARK